MRFVWYEVVGFALVLRPFAINKKASCPIRRCCNNEFLCVRPILQLIVLDLVGAFAKAGAGLRARCQPTHAGPDPPLHKRPCVPLDIPYTYVHTYPASLFFCFYFAGFWVNASKRERERERESACVRAAEQSSSIYEWVGSLLAAEAHLFVHVNQPTYI